MICFNITNKRTLCLEPITFITPPSDISILIRRNRDRCVQFLNNFFECFACEKKSSVLFEKRNWGEGFRIFVDKCYVDHFMRATCRIFKCTLAGSLGSAGGRGLAWIDLE